MISRQMRYKNANRERVRAAEALAARKRRAANPEKYRAQSRSWRGIPEPTRPEPTVCESCSGPPKGKHKRLVVDHDHNTGAFRGWLCDICNRAIGMLGDNTSGVANALAYLERA
jgi:hypothetical protein